MTFLFRACRKNSSHPPPAEVCNAAGVLVDYLRDHSLRGEHLGLRTACRAPWGLRSGGLWKSLRQNSFSAALENSTLLSPEQLSRAKSIAAQNSDSQAIARLLLREGLITHWQAVQCAGKCGAPPQGRNRSSWASTRS